MTKNRFFLILVSLIFLAACQQSPKRSEPNSNVGQMFVTAKAFKTKNGWGYDIFADDKLYIHQAFIPSVPGTKSFANEEDAVKVGKLAIHKMELYHKMPYISQNDLAELHIQIPD